MANRPFAHMETGFIVIDGKKYPTSGAIKNPGGWTYSGAKPWFYAAFDVTAPYLPPEGYTFETFALKSASTTFVCTSELKRAEKLITCRVIQTWSDDVNRLSLIGWRLVSTSTDPNRLNN